jgi:hypothetical protein
MLRPFEKIIISSSYNLKYAWGDNKVNIIDCLLKTKTQYGDLVSEKDFSAMIAVLTKGAKSGCLYYRREPEIIKILCAFYPNFINNKKIIDNILKCINVSSYPQSCVTDIISTGYKFTEVQIAILNKEGYIVFDIIDNMSYKEFLSLFDNTVFMQGILIDIQLSYNTPIGKTKIDEKTSALKNTLDRFELKIDSTFIDKFLSKIAMRYGTDGVCCYSNTVLNIHIIAKDLGLEILPKESFELLIEKYPQFYAIYTYMNKFVHISFSDIEKDIIVMNARKIIKFYDNPIKRDIILRVMTPDVFIIFVTPETSDYDPTEDIFYILSSINEKKLMNDARNIIIKHFLNNGYLVYDKFLMLLISLGLTEYDQRSTDISGLYPSLLVDCMRNCNISISQHEIENIFTFCNFATINALSDIKIIPTKELMSLNLYKHIISRVVNNSVFVDDDTVEYSELVNSHYDGGSNNENEKNEIVKIYKSLNDRDKQIYERINNSMGYIANIIRYRMTLTKEYVATILRSDKWREVVFLLHLSQEYDYIIDFIDENIILMIPSLIGRIWFYNNLLIKGRQTFALPNKFYKLQPNICVDVDELLMKPIMHDIESITKNIKKMHDDTRLSLISNGNAIRNASPKTTSSSIKSVKDDTLSRSDDD